LFPGRGYAALGGPTEGLRHALTRRVIASPSTPGITSWPVPGSGMVAIHPSEWPFGRKLKPTMVNLSAENAARALDCRECRAARRQQVPEESLAMRRVPDESRLGIWARQDDAYND